MIYCIGDIHGEAEALRQMLRCLPTAPSDLVIFLGDAINRGPDPYDSVEQIIAFDRCNKVFIQGNHAELMLLYLAEGYTDALIGMGGETTLASYEQAGYYLQSGNPDSMPESHLRFYAQAEPWTLPFYVTETHIFTHAGWDLSLPGHKQSPGRLRWGKVDGYARAVMKQTVIDGHAPVPKVTFTKSKPIIHMDTGCGLGGFLSAISVPAYDKYTTRPASFRVNWYSSLRG